MNAALPPGRYPTSAAPSIRRRWTILLTVLVIIAGCVIAWIGYTKFADPDVSGDATSHDVLNDSTVRVDFTVTRSNPSKPVTCLLRSRARDGSETGRREVLVPPSDSDSVSMSAIVRTSAWPMTGEVYGCGESVPSYLQEATPGN